MNTSNTFITFILEFRGGERKGGRGESEDLVSDRVNSLGDTGTQSVWGWNLGWEPQKTGGLVF